MRAALDALHDLRGRGGHRGQDELARLDALQEHRLQLFAKRCPVTRGLLACAHSFYAAFAASTLSTTGISAVSTSCLSNLATSGPATMRTSSPFSLHRVATRTKY